MNVSVAKVGILGCGRIAGHHCRSIIATEGADLVAVCDLDISRAKAYEDEFGAKAYANYHQMLGEHPQINIVAIVTPSGTHYNHGKEIIEWYGKSIIVEKPAFLRPSQLIDAYETAAQHNVAIFPVLQNRRNRAVQRVKEALLSGELGNVRVASVRVRWCRPQRYYDLAPWRGTFAQDGGALTNQGIHHVDLLRYLGGEVEWVNATMRMLGADIEVEDSVVAMMKYASGAIGVLEVTTAARPDDFEASISLVCEKGLAQIGGVAVNELQIFSPDPTACAENSEDFYENLYGDGHRAMYRDIVAHYREGKPYPVDQDDSLRTIQLLHAFYRSDEVNDWVDVNSPGESSRLGRADDALANLYRTPPELRDMYE